VTKVFEALKYDEKRRGLTNSAPLPLVSQQPAVKKDVRGDIGETMMGLYQAITSALPGKARKIVQFVGSSEGEGTSTVVRQLALVSAVRMGRSILVLDADRTRPVQHRLFNAVPQAYLEDAMKNGGSIENIFSRFGDTNLFVGLLSRAGTPVSELLDSRYTTETFARFRTNFDLTLIDCPPVTNSPDCLALCPFVDGVVLVVEAENTRWPVAEATKDKIVRAGGNLLGMVLNKRQFHIPEFVYSRL
jgi:protein-tyrosine kinase